MRVSVSIFANLLAKIVKVEQNTKKKAIYFLLFVEDKVNEGP